MQAVARSSLRKLASRNLGSVRNMSGSGNIEVEIKEMKKWRNITFFVGFPASGGLLVYNLAQNHTHEHPPDYPYMKIRAKDFPWGKCDLFDTECKKGGAH